MPGFGITPVGAFPPASSDGFPRFIQFQAGGVDVGDRSVETLNFIGSVGASVSSDGATVTVDVDSTTPLPTFAWFDTPGDYTLTLADASNGLRMSGTTGSQVVTIPTSAALQFADGDAVLVRQYGDAHVEFVADGGNLVYRDTTFLPSIAGRNGIVTLIYDAGLDEWILCGDMELL